MVPPSSRFFVECWVFESLRKGGTCPICGNSPRMIALPTPDPKTLSNRAEIAAALKAIVPDGVIGDEATLTAFDCDALTAYRQRPLLCVLPQTAEQVSAILEIGRASCR